MLDEKSHLTLFEFKPPEERIIDNYMIGHELEVLVREVLQKNFNIACKRHFVTEPGPDAEFRDGAVEMINCKPYLTVSETRFRRILQNLKQKRNKIVIASYTSIFTKKQTTLLRKRGVRIIEIGTQILPEYVWNRKSPEKRLGTKKSSRRNLKCVKNQILSQLLKIKELFLIYYPRKITYNEGKITGTHRTCHILLKRFSGRLEKMGIWHLREESENLKLSCYLFWISNRLLAMSLVGHNRLRTYTSKIANHFLDNLGFHSLRLISYHTQFHRVKS